MEQVKLESESKFSKPNTQVKYHSFDSHEVIKSKISFICEILDIKIAKQRVIELIDNYYDTKNFDLLNSNITLRKRTTELKSEFTLKLPISANQNEISRNEITSIIDTPENEKELLTNLLTEHLFLLSSKSISLSEIKPIVIVNNERLKFHLAANDIEAILCFDKFYFYSDVDYSEYNYQVELEFKGQNSNSQNEKFSKLKECICELFHFKPETKTKYSKSVSWLKDKTPKVRNISAIMIDIVSYSLRNNLQQRNLIQHLNKETKQILNDIYNPTDYDEKIEYIPTGDGMIIILYDTPTKIPSICANIQNRIREYNNRQIEEGLKYSIRIGVNYGPVFVYSDIKENLNFAGNGINMVQRITNLGDSGHILFSKEAYDLLIDKANFKNEGKHKIKHGLELEVYSFCSQEYKFGNPTHIK